MAHVQKNTRVATGHLFDHYGRNAEEEKYKYLYRSNDSIDPERTALNYNLAPDKREQKEILEERLSQVKVLNRKDVNVMCSWVVTRPKDLDQNQEKEFFKETYKFLENRYGSKNVISSYVHLDETTPHMHFAFAPITFDKKKGIEKLSAKEVITRTDLKSFHTDLQEHLDKANIRCNVLNEATKEGNKSINELKRGTATKELKNIQNNIKLAQSVKIGLTEDVGVLKSDLRALEGICASIDDIEHIDVKEGFLGGKVTLKKNDYDKLISLAKQGVVNANKVDELTRINEKLIEDVKSNKKGLKEARSEHLEIKTEFIGMKKKFKDLREPSEAMFEVLKKHNLVPEAKEYLQAKRVADKVLNKNKSWDMER